ncbi:MAG: TRAP transporter substrate-binding protein DctP [Thermodesulfobacteriota bacterium]
MKITSLAPALLIVLLSAFSTLSHGADPIAIKFATVAPEGSTWMKTMRELDAAIKQKSGGQVSFRIYAGGVAGDELDVLRKIRIGQIHAAAFSGVGFGEILPMVRVMDLPFLFRSCEEVDRVHAEMENHFAGRFREKGFELLAWAEVGNVHLFSQDPIRKVGDMERLKVWAWSGDPIAKETFSAMGTNPIPLTIADVLTALNTGMIDTVYAPPLGAIALQWHRSVKFMTSLPLAHSTGAVLISSSTFQKIPPALSGMMRDEFRSAMSRLTRELRTQNDESIKVLEKGGLTILPMPAGADLKEFYAVHDRVARGLAGKVYPQEVLERVYGILGRGK